jgi:pyruvate dehydrogenase (quinone)
VLDVLTDPAVPPLPPHITLEEAKMFAPAVAKGDPGRRGMIQQSFKEKLAEFMPGRR